MRNWRCRSIELAERFKRQQAIAARVSTDVWTAFIASMSEGQPQG
jgi:hypothetical protein